MLRSFAVALLCLAALPVSAEERPAVSATFASPITVADVQPHVEYLAAPERRGRPGGAATDAADYIARHFAELELQPAFAASQTVDAAAVTAEFAAYFQPIPAPAADAPAALLGRNVAAVLPGSDPQLRHEIIILSAHYDHLGIRGGETFAGADDNASGVAMLLEVARRLAQAPTPPRRSVAFVAFDLEERMLFGSQWFAAHLPWPQDDVKLFLTADMIGRSLGNLDLPTVFVLGSEHAPQLKTVLDRAGQPQGLEVARLGIDLIGTRSDYGPFRDRKIPFLFFSTGQSAVYHTPKDVPETLDYPKLAKVAGLVERIVTIAANDDAVPQWTDTLKPDLDEARALNRIAGMLLESPGARKFGALQRMTISQAKSRTDAILSRGTMTADERSWLVKLSQVMLLSVF